MNKDIDRFLRLHKKTESKEKVDVFNPKSNRSSERHPSSSDTGFNETYSNETLSPTDDSNLESQALLTINLNSAIFFNNQRATQNNYKIVESLGNDEKTAEYELRTYLIKTKSSDSSPKLVPDTFSCSDKISRMPFYANEFEAEVEDEENVKYDLRTYSLKKKFNSSNAQLDDFSPSFPDNESLLINTTFQSQDPNCNFPGYLKKNESD